VLAIQNFSRPAAAATIPGTGALAPAQIRPLSAVRSGQNYLEAHSDPSAQAVPEAGVQKRDRLHRLHNATLRCCRAQTRL
jgi:hypothetical protein